MSDAAMRNRVSQIAVDDPRKALELSRRIVDPWFRCQALAHAACGSPEPGAKTRLLREAFATATETPDLNRTVSVSAWPLKVLCKSKKAGNLTAETKRLLALAQQEKSPVRRADALNLVLGAVLTGPHGLFLEVLKSFRVACLTPLENGKRNRKGESLLAQWVVIVHRRDPSLAEDLLQSLSSQDLRERARTGLAESGHLDVESLCTWPNIAQG